MLFFTGVMGLMLSNILSVVLGRADGWQLIALAAMGTGAVVFGCAAYATTTKRDFSAAGGTLFGLLIALVVVSLANLFFQIPILGVILSFIAIILFSAFMVFDVQRVVNGGETNYILAATSIYLNIYNIFSSILNLLQVFSSDD
jgi:FtsH-binding integral membrane protein